jgi:hypothetical protein
MKVLMSCGHQANGEHEGRPVCVICFGIHPGADTYMEEPPDLRTRMAVCPDCGQTRLSATPSLPFFQYRPDQETDSFYCGCRGWN